jgi:hypothetical protein
MTAAHLSSVKTQAAAAADTFSGDASTIQFVAAKPTEPLLAHLWQLLVAFSPSQTL